MSCTQEIQNLKEEIKEIVSELNGEQYLDLLKSIRFELKSSIMQINKINQSPFTYCMTKMNNNMNELHLN